MVTHEETRRVLAMANAVSAGDLGVIPVLLDALSDAGFEDMVASSRRIAVTRNYTTKFGAHVKNCLTAAALFDAVDALDHDAVPVVSTASDLTHREAALLARRLFKKLNLVGISVTVPASCYAVRVAIPSLWQKAQSFFDIELDPDDQARATRYRKVENAVESVLLRAFPNYGVCESQLPTDYFNVKWHVYFA